MKQSAIPPRASRTQDYVPPDLETDESDVPDSYYNTRLPTSVRRYHDTRGNQVIEQDNRRIIVH